MKIVYRLYIALLIIEIIFVIICGPHSCEWGNTVYFYFGIASLPVSFLLPFIQKEWKVNRRIAFGFLFLFASAITWIAGFMLGGFRIMCRLI